MDWGSEAGDIGRVMLLDVFLRTASTCSLAIPVPWASYECHSWKDLIKSLAKWRITPEAVKIAVQYGHRQVTFEYRTGGDEVSF